jgi:hypothetical protein
MNILMTYLVLISPITFFLGFWIGRRYGWDKRDNIERMADLNREKEKVSKLSEKLDNLLPPKIKKMEFNIIGVRIKEDKKILTLEEELKEALDNEDYERAAEIKKKIDDKK